MSWQSILKATGVGKDGMTDNVEEVKSEKANIKYRDVKPITMNKNGINLFYLFASNLHQTNTIKELMREWSETGVISSYPKNEGKVGSRQLRREINKLKNLLTKTSDEIVHLFSNFDVKKSDITNMKSNLDFIITTLDKTKKPKKEIIQNRVKKIIDNIESKGRNVSLEDMKELDDFLNAKPRESELIEYDVKNNNRARKVIVDATKFLNREEKTKTSEAGTYGTGQYERNIKYIGIGYDTKGITLTMPDGKKRELPDYIQLKTAKVLAGNKPSSKIERTKLGRIFDLPEFAALTPKRESQTDKTVSVTPSNRVSYLTHLLTLLSGSERFDYLPYMDKGNRQNYADIYGIQSGTGKGSLSTGRLPVTTIHLLQNPTYQQSSTKFKTPITKDSLSENTILNNLSTKSKSVYNTGDEKLIKDLYNKYVKEKVEDVVLPSGEVRGKFAQSREGLTAFKQAIKADSNLNRIYQDMIKNSKVSYPAIDKEVFDELTEFISDKSDIEDDKELDLEEKNTEIEDLQDKTIDSFSQKYGFDEDDILDVLYNNRLIDALSDISTNFNTENKTYEIKNKNSAGILRPFLPLVSDMSEKDAIDDFLEQIEDLSLEEKDMSVSEKKKELLKPKESTVLNMHNLTFGSLITILSLLGSAQGNRTVYNILDDYLYQDVDDETPDVTFKKLRDVVKNQYPIIVEQFNKDIDDKISQVVNLDINRLSDLNKDPYTYLIDKLKVGVS